MQVRDIMTQNPACCTPDATLQEVARMMKENDCGCIPVVNNYQEMKPVGTVTDRDITIRTVADSHNPINMKASDIMTSDIATVKPQTSVEECFDVMEDREIRRVIVVDEQGKCCGIVAQADVVQSNANPIRTNKVIREISESAPSRNRSVSYSGERDYQIRPSQQSFISSNSLLPLLIGLGSGAALTYFLNTPRRASNRGYIGNLDTHPYESDFLNATNEENFGKYTDAEQEIEKRQHNLEDRAQSLRGESSFSVGGSRSSSFDREDETITNREKGKTANPGKF
jgi:CBS domain-containing protein